MNSDHYQIVCRVTQRIKAAVDEYTGQFREDAPPEVCHAVLGQELASVRFEADKWWEEAFNGVTEILVRPLSLWARWQLGSSECGL
jgi:hypothetical protein